MRCSRAKWAARTLPSMPRWPKPPGTRMPADAVEPLVQVVVGQRLGIDPADLGVDLVRPGRVAERLGDRQVGVGQLDVLADEGDLEDRLRRLDPVDERAPRVEVGLDLRVAEAELADDELAEAGRLEHAAGPRRSCRRSRPG